MVPQVEPIRRLKGLYRGLGYVTLFTHWRCSHAPYMDVERLMPKKGRILDLGCGYGLFANLLALTSPEREVVGIDMCARKLKYAMRNLPKTSFLRADAFSLADLGRYDAIAMNHLLHHLASYDDQERLLKACYRALNEGGCVVILEINTRPYCKFLFTQLVDNVAYPGGRFYFRSSEEFKKLLAVQGFTHVETYPAWHNSLLSHAIIYGKKPAQGGA